MIIKERWAYAHNEQVLHMQHAIDVAGLWSRSIEECTRAPIEKFRNDFLSTLRETKLGQAGGVRTELHECVDCCTIVHASGPLDKKYGMPRVVTCNP